MTHLLTMADKLALIKREENGILEEMISFCARLQASNDKAIAILEDRVNE